jgi:hypothetical protein
MSFGGYWVVYDSTPVSEVKEFLNVNDFDVTCFKEYLSNKFNRHLRMQLTSFSDFDNVSVHLVILGFKNKNLNPNVLKNIIHFLIYHHYMVLYHKISSDHEINQMRQKIAGQIGVDLKTYLEDSS